MKFKQTLQPGILQRRYKRFLADILLPDGREITVHCPNSGSMLGMNEPGMRVLLSRSDNPGRKYPQTLEMVLVGDVWVGVNTSLTNRIVREGIEEELITEIGRVESIRPEVKVDAGSRLDFLLTRGDEKIYVEVKNCTLAEDGVAMFPDAVTVRGTKHLNALMELVKAGNRGVVFFLVQRSDAGFFGAAEKIDPVYAETLRIAAAIGVEVLAYQAGVEPGEIRITRRIPVII